MDTLAQAIIEAVGRQSVCLDGAEVARYTWDGLGPSRGYRHLPRLKPKPRLILRPQSTEEVAAIVRYTAQEGIPVVPYGGGSGLMGGAIALAPAIVIDLTRMNRILEINRRDRMARVEAGTFLADLERALNEQGLILGHDPWSLPIATVGGAIATNGLGYRAAKYGPMGRQVLGLTAVLPDGRILRTRAVEKASVGFDLKQLFIGSEGCFGIVTEATLRVFSQPEARALVAFAFPSFEEGFVAVQALFDIGLVPTLLDFGEGFPRPPLGRRGRRWRPQAQEATLYLAFEGLQEEVAAQEGRAEGICQASGGRPLSQEEARQFWNHRHDIAQRYAQSRLSRRGGRAAASSGLGFDYVHVALPASCVLEYRRRCQEILATHGIHPLEFGLWCTPELFSAVVTQVSLGPRGRHALAQAMDDMLTLAQDMGGSMEYCHGVGVRLAHLTPQELGHGLEVMRALKRALDPKGIMNPGKLGL